MKIFKSIIINEKFCKPPEFTKEQLLGIENFKKQQFEQLQKEQKELEEKKRQNFDPNYNHPNFGLGDAVAKIAQPIAKTIDFVVGTDIQHCGACKKRQEVLNKLIPNIKIND